MKRFRDIFIGVIIGCILMISTPVIADSILTKIDVVLNGVNVQVEGTDVEVNSILYNGSTYLPMRKVAELVGKDVDWNSETKTANIVDKVKEGDDVTVSFTEKERGIIVDNKGNEYYSPRYIADLINVNGAFYGITTRPKDDGKYEIYMFDKDKNVILDKIPYIEFIGGAYISKDYYENTILPLIEK